MEVYIHTFFDLGTG